MFFVVNIIKQDFFALVYYMVLYYLLNIKKISHFYKIYIRLAASSYLSRNIVLKKLLILIIIILIIKMVNFKFKIKNEQNITAMEAQETYKYVTKQLRWH